MTERSTVTVDLSDPAAASGRCLLETQARVAEIRDHGGMALYLQVTGLHYPGREHWAVLLPDDPSEPTEGRVVDLTARQFDPAARSPWEGDLDDWLDDACEWLQDGLLYAIYDHFSDEEPIMLDRWVREDVLPGPMLFRVGPVSLTEQVEQHLERTGAGERYWPSLAVLLDGRVMDVTDSPMTARGVADRLTHRSGLTASIEDVPARERS